MAYDVIIHIQNSEPIRAEMEELPGLSDTMIKILNPRQRDGKDLHYIDPEVVTIYWAISQISFLYFQSFLLIFDNNDRLVFEIFQTIERVLITCFFVDFVFFSQFSY